MKKKRKFLRYFLIVAAVAATILVCLFVVTNSNVINLKDMEVASYTAFKNDIAAGTISTVYYSEDCGYVYVQKTDDTYYKTSNPEYDEFKKELLEADLIVQSANEFEAEQATSSNLFLLILINVCLPMITVVVLFYAIVTMVQLQGNPTQTVINAKGTDNKQNAENKNVKKFEDVAGLYEVKKDVQSLVDFLKNKEKYIEAGATLPRGVIFYGPPGTGKTLLAKAIAGEAGVPFIYMSGSSFIELYVGMGAKRVRELFAQAKKQAPCIVFIDEIDTIGGKRSTNDRTGEERKTLNALLTEMDGFQSTDNILVIAATNRIEDLDPALTRPGRFTNKFCVPLPETAKERLEIIKLYEKNKQFSEDVDFEALSKELVGFSPAAIESMMNEAAIISVQNGKQTIDKDAIDNAMLKMLLSGHIKEDQSERSEEELRLVAWHEAGHALIGKLNGKSIPKVTILPTTSGAGGVTLSTPKAIGLHSVNSLKSEVSELYAGRVAELLLLKDKGKVTTGASNDIQRATEIIKEIVTSYGMSDEFGLLNLNQLQVSQSEIIAHEIKLAKEIENDTIETLTKHYDILKNIAEALLENETLYENDLDAIISQ